MERYSVNPQPLVFVIDVLYKIPDKRPCVIDEAKLSSDIGYLMVGIASETFPYDEAAR